VTAEPCAIVIGLALRRAVVEQQRASRAGQWERSGDRAQKTAAIRSG
jgi:hypothetical protein